MRSVRVLLRSLSFNRVEESISLRNWERAQEIQEESGIPGGRHRRQESFLQVAQRESLDFSGVEQISQSLFIYPYVIV